MFEQRVFVQRLTSEAAVVDVQVLLQLLVARRVATEETLADLHPALLSPAAQQLQLTLDLYPTLLAYVAKVVGDDAATDAHAPELCRFDLDHLSRRTTRLEDVAMTVLDRCKKQSRV